MNLSRRSRCEARGLSWINPLSANILLRQMSRLKFINVSEDKFCVKGLVHFISSIAWNYSVKL